MAYSFQNAASSLKYESNPDGINKIIDEYGNMIIAVREVRWKPDKPYKLDIRKYITSEEGEKPMKGISFLTDEGPGELATTLLEAGYGNDVDVAKRLYESRPALCNNIMDLMNGVKLEVPETSSNLDDLYDPRSMFDNEEWAM